MEQAPEARAPVGRAPADRAAVPRGTGACSSPSIGSSSDAPCSAPAPSGDCTASGFDAGCAGDSVCISGTNGRCINQGGGLAAPCLCTYDACVHDSDCPDGQTCACHGAPYTDGRDNACVKGNCRVDTDCAPGRYCSPSILTAECGDSLAGYYCHTAADLCVDDSDCRAVGSRAGIPSCVYSTTDSRWECAVVAVCQTMTRVRSLLRVIRRRAVSAFAWVKECAPSSWAPGQADPDGHARVGGVGWQPAGAASASAADSPAGGRSQAGHGYGPHVVARFGVADRPRGARRSRVAPSRGTRDTAKWQRAAPERAEVPRRAALGGPQERAATAEQGATAGQGTSYETWPPPRRTGALTRIKAPAIPPIWVAVYRSSLDFVALVRSRSFCMRTRA